MASSPRPDPELTAQRVVLGDLELDLLRPLDPEALLDEEAFEHEEFLPYWAQLWPSAAVLAEALVARPDLAGLDVLELGCGLGLSGLAAAARGARVTATDWAPDALDLLRRNAGRNGIELTVRRLDWFADAGAPLFADGGTGGSAATAGDEAGPERGGWPLVLAADVLYEARNGPALLATLERVVAPGGEAWIADPGRPPARRFWPLADATWTVEVLGDPAPEDPTVRRLRRRGPG